MIELYDNEKNQTVRRTTLSHRSLFPSNFDKQSVNLPLQVFHENNVAALAQDGKTQTASFIFHVMKKWKILNNKSLDAHIKLNDPDRRPISSYSDPQIHFLRNMSENFEIVNDNTISSVPRHVRVLSLTKETRSSLTQTLDGFCDLIKSLLNKDNTIQYILLGNLQSDVIEAEFGIYHQMFGGLYHVAVEQILMGARIRRLSIINDFEAIDDKILSESTDSCCRSDFTEEE